MNKQELAHAHTYLGLVLSSGYILSCLDELEHTPYYEQSLKNRANSFRRELLRTSEKDLSAAWGIDDDVFYALIQKVDDLFDILSRSRPESIGLAVAIFNRITEDPEKVVQALGIKREEVLM